MGEIGSGTPLNGILKLGGASSFAAISCEVNISFRDYFSRELERAAYFSQLIRRAVIGWAKLASTDMLDAPVEVSLSMPPTVVFNRIIRREDDDRPAPDMPVGDRGGPAALERAAGWGYASAAAGVTTCAEAFEYPGWVGLGTFFSCEIFFFALGFTASIWGDYWTDWEHGGGPVGGGPPPGHKFDEILGKDPGGER
jgi:hypothetical protein